uniref:Uncharacterized protein n=1 Tax=Wuchereria bancrofti TaxID=6293 RepID=A0AAF5PG91_WUCBA
MILLLSPIKPTWHVMSNTTRGNDNNFCNVLIRVMGRQRICGRVNMMTHTEAANTPAVQTSGNTVV